MATTEPVLPESKGSVFDMPPGVESHTYHGDVKSRVFVVEDSPEQRDALTRQLSSLGHEYRAASTCDEARRLIHEGPYGVGLIDIGLPDGRGLDLLEEFHETDPYMVPVILTGEQDIETVIEAMRGGAFDYLMKPVSMMTLTGGIRRAQAHHALLRERGTLIKLLREERDQLKERVDEATRDIRAYAQSCEHSNALLHTLLHLTRLSAGFHSDEDLLRNVFGEIRKHLPLRCAALCDVHHREFLGAVAGRGDGIDIVVSKADAAQNGLDSAIAQSEPDLLTRYWVQRHTGLDTSRAQSLVLPQTFWGRAICIVGFYVDREHKLDEQEQEFLGMCAHFLAFEWQRSRLLLHAAQHASLGNIALELSKSFLQSLTAIRTAADVVTETVDSEEAAEGLNIIGHNVEFLTNQTQGFHDLSQVREDSVETVSVRDYLDQTLDILSTSIQNRGLHILKDFRAESECLLLNGAALARTFLDLISSVVRTAAADGELYIGVTAPSDDRVECTISHTITDHELFGLTTEGRTQSAVELVRGHPNFLLAQRTVQSCGGKLGLERNDARQNTFRILLPRNALNAPLVEEPIR